MMVKNLLFDLGGVIMNIRRQNAVDALIKIIDNDCKNDYIDRVENFFVNIDKNNSKRVIDAVLADSAKPKVSFFKELIQKIKG